MKREDKRIDFTLPHATIALQDQGIGKDMVVRAIRSPTRTRRTRTARRVRFEKDLLSGRGLVVIVEESADTLLVITAWTTS